MILTYLSILWANATTLPLFASFFLGDTFKVGYLYTVFGYDVYVGEVLLTIGSIGVVALLCAKGKRVYHKLMVVLVISLAVVLLACVVACFLLRAGVQATLAPLVIPNKNVFTQLFGIALLTPWAFIGFEAISHGSEEFAFPKKQHKSLLYTIVGVTFALYVLMILLSVCAFPQRYGNWLDYNIRPGKPSGTGGVTSLLCGV